MSPPHLVVLLNLCLCGVAFQVNISNVEPKRDALGQLMDVHDGNIVQWSAGGLYYWYGMGYTNCTLERGILPPRDCPGIYHESGGCGFRTDHALNVYASPDLVEWTFQGEALPMAGRPLGIYYRPKVVFNSKTREYVLWINYVPDGIPLLTYSKAKYIVATSKSAAGPFQIVNAEANVQFGGGGDFDVFVDKDGAGYIAYDAWSNSHRVGIEKLTDDYHDSLGANVTTGPLSTSSNEAPVLFERNGWYYLLFGHTCCFCRSGSNVAVWVARHPLGPWNATGIDIGGKPGWIDGGTSYTKTQENCVFKAHIEGGGVEYVWTGDRWGSAPDGLKSHDFQYWQPLAFDDSVSPPTIAKTHWMDSFRLQLPGHVLV